MRYANEKIVEKLKKRYPEGCRVDLVKIHKNKKKPIGTKGTVFGVDDAGSIMVSWDSGSHLSIIYGEDLCRKINE